MKDRIRELAEQAGFNISNDPIDGHDFKYEIEKFAELIVTECVDICNQATLQNQDTLSKLNTDELAEKMIIHGSINQAQKLGKGIKEHFGVEE
jgi:hypothetical protein